MRPTTILAIAVFCSLLPAASAVGQVAEQDPPPIREQSIYIPYDRLQETFEKEGRGVFVPYERFQELWKAAREKETRPPEAVPPVQAMITEIDSQAVVEEDVVRVRATAKIDLLTDGWLTIPLRLADAAVLSATIADEPARLIPQQGGGQALLLKKEGKPPEQISLQLEYAKAFTKAPGQNSVSFQAPLAPVNRWQIRVPDKGVKVNVHPMLAATEVPSAAGEDDTDGDGDSGDEPAESDETVVLAFVGAAPSVRIDWTPKAEGATGLEALVSAQTRQQITIDEGITRTHTTLTYEVSRSELSQLNVEVPADQKVVNVIDANVRGWSVAAHGDVQKITVELFQPAQRVQQLVVELEKFLDDQQVTEVDAPTVKAVGVGRQRGILLVQVQAGLRAEAVRRSGLSQMDLSEISSVSRQPVAMSYRYAALPFELGLQVEKVLPRITADQLVEAFLEPRKLTYVLVAKYDIQRAGVFELQCQIPDGFEVRDVRGQACSGAKEADVESFAADAEDSTRLKINLGSKASGSVGLAVELTRDLDEPNLLTPTSESVDLDFAPPYVTGDNIVRATGRVVVYAPESLRIGTVELTGLRSVSFEEALRPIPSVASQRYSELRPTLAYEFSGESVSAQASVERRQPQVTARQLLVARIDPGVVKYEATFYFNVRYSGVDSLRLDVPEAIVGRLRNETRTLRETPIEPPPEDVTTGFTALRFTGDTELLGQKQFRLTWEEPIEELSVGNSVDLPVPRLIPQNVARADGQIVLVKAETIDVRPQGEAEGLDPIDPEIDLMAGANVADAAAALEFRDSDWELTLTATRYQLELLKHTSVEQAVLRMVITRSDRIAVQALYRLRSNMQRLELELPDDVAEGKIAFDTEPLRVNGRAVTLERGDDAKTFYVPLVGYATNEPLLLELRFTMPGQGNVLRYPTFPNEPAIQRVHLVAYVPQERDFIGRRGPWTPEMAWRTGDFFERRYVPQSGVETLINNLQSGISVVGNPAGDFPVDGKPLLFTTLRPLHPDDGALRLSTIDRKVLDAIVLVGMLTLGVTLLARPYVDRLIVGCGVVGSIVLLGVFLPTLAGQIVDQTLLVAAVLVALLWFAVSAMKVIPKLGQLNWRLGLGGAGARTGTVTEAAPVADGAPAAAPPPDSGPSHDVDQPEGGEHHG